jgi:hypothetical protein
VPNLYCVAICRLHCFGNGFLVISTFDVSGAEKATIESDDGDSICGHVAVPISGGSDTGLCVTDAWLSPLSVMKLI